MLQDILCMLCCVTHILSGNPVDIVVVGFGQHSSQALLLFRRSREISNYLYFKNRISFPIIAKPDVFLSNLKSMFLV